MSCVRIEIKQWEIFSFPTIQELRGDVRVAIVEAGENLLGAFDSSLQSYVKRKLETRQIEVLTCSVVKQVCGDSVLLEQRNAVDGAPPTELPFGMCVWATGNQPLDFVKSLGLASFTSGPDHGRILIDEHLRIVDESVPNYRDIFALGDCAADKDNPLGLLAQVQKRLDVNFLSLNKNDLFCHLF